MATGVCADHAPLDRGVRAEGVCRDLVTLDVPGDCDGVPVRIRAPSPLELRLTLVIILIYAVVVPLEQDRLRRVCVVAVRIYGCLDRRGNCRERSDRSLCCMASGVDRCKIELNRAGCRERIRRNSQLICRAGGNRNLIPC